MLRRSPLRRRTALRPKKDPLKAYCWALLRAIVLYRDGYKCRKCGRSEPAVVLQVSHIKSRGAHPSLAWNVENCLALCKKDHLYWWHRDPQDAAEWCLLNLDEQTRRKLDFTARMNGRRGGSDLGLVRIALEQDMKRLGLPLPAAPQYATSRSLKARRPR